MSEPRHSTLANGRWAELPLPTQMGNIGSEISRALRWKAKGNTARMTSCVERALELTDLSIQCAQLDRSRKEHPGAIRELTLVRDEICEYFLEENDELDGNAILRYFDQFAFYAVNIAK